MRRLNAAVLAAIAACGPPTARHVSSDSGKFRFRPDRVPVATAFHYVKSNIDGTQAIPVSVFVADTSRVEVLKLEPAHRDAALVLAHLDWTTFSADTIESLRLSADGGRETSARAWLDPAGLFVAELRGRRDTVRVDQLPAHVYDFDFISLAQTFAHLRDPEGTFTIGVLSTVFEDGPRLISFDGAATVRFAGESPCHTAVCRRYEVSGPWLRNRSGTIWTDRMHGHVVNIEIPLPDNPAWRDFKLELQRTERMDRAAWERWVTGAARGL